MVVAYHYWPHRMPGGFTGVDVFFVLSGYLITGNMLREVASSGSLSLRRFWANRVRRILPASLLAIAVTVLASLALLPPSWWDRLREAGLAATFYFENWSLSWQSVDYLAAAEPDTPFQHFWSLAVEEQFYLIWPLIVALAAVLIRRRTQSSAAAKPGWGFRRCLGVVFALLALASFAWSTKGALANDPTAYFITPTRLWQLAVGGVLALWPARCRLASWLKTTLAVLGLVLAGASAWLINGHTPFPGPAALLPTAAAAAIILAGPWEPVGQASLTAITQTTNRLERVLRCCLSWRPVQWVGDLSYSIYLWHFPPLAIFGALRGRPPGGGEVFALIGLSMLLAVLSYYLVEQPIRLSVGLRKRPGLTLLTAAGAMALATTVCLVPSWSLDHLRRLWTGPVPTTGFGSPFGAPALADHLDDPSLLDPAMAITPSVFGKVPSARMPGKKAADCLSQMPQGSTEQTCRFTASGQTATGKVMLVGDSIAAQYIPAVLDIAERRNWEVVTRLKSGCAFSTENSYPYTEEPHNTDCLTYSSNTLALILQEQPALVITSASAKPTYAGAESGELAGVTGFVEAWQPITQANIPLLVIRPIPRAGAVRDCLSEHIDKPLLCTFSPQQELLTNNQAIFDRAGELVPAARQVDLNDQLCGPERCYPVIGNVMVWRDEQHLTVEYARSLDQRLDQEVTALVGSLPG
jgi:peptidoglycan/LPS O-acetylase OafA/YrhL